jgi:endonuclease/exonuclease/phosphatase family metal-dependent hydrolase
MQRFLVVALAGLLLGCGGDDDGGGGDRRVTALTRNLFLGSGLEALFAGGATNPPAAVRTMWDEVRASDPPARMARVADEIAARAPDLVGLQEAALFRTLVPPAISETVEYDFVELILAGLRQRGLGYRAVAQSVNFDQAFPDDTGRLVHFTDRDVILARDGVATREAADGRFPTLLSLPFGLFTVTVPRGWCAATADVDGATVRFVNTHLEAVPVGGVREAQARELAALLAAEARPLLLVGDVNSPPSDATGAAGILRDAGYADAWDRLRPGEAGLTCCFETDLRTADPLETRVDVVLFRNALTPLGAEVIGEEAADRTAGGLWPADHAGVVATLEAG